MASTPITIAIAKKCFRDNKGKTKKICIIPGAVLATADITLPMRLSSKTPCPINSITHIDLTTTEVYRHNLIGDGAASDQIVYAAAAEHDTDYQFDIKSQTVIRLNEATAAKSILIIEAVFEDN